MDMIQTPLPAWLLILAWGGLLGALALALMGGGVRAVLCSARGHLYPATLVSQLVLQRVRGRFAAHPFGYIMLSGFAGAGVAMAASLAVISVILLAASPLDPDHLLAQFTLTGVLMLFPEAFLTGSTVAWLAMFYPAALCTWTPPWAHGGDDP